MGETQLRGFTKSMKRNNNVSWVYSQMTKKVKLSTLDNQKGWFLFVKWKVWEKMQIFANYLCTFACEFQLVFFFVGFLSMGITQNVLLVDLGRLKPKEGPLYWASSSFYYSFSPSLRMGPPPFVPCPTQLPNLKTL